jgi:hypothetical protein
MWRVYGAYHYGFALEVELHDLYHAFIDSGISAGKIGMGFVLYLTRDQIAREYISLEDEPYYAFLIKSPEFSPENELRLYVNTVDDKKSCDVPVNLKRAIKRIHVSPFMHRWAVDSVMRTIDRLCVSKGLPELVYRPRDARIPL